MEVFALFLAAISAIAALPTLIRELRPDGFVDNTDSVPLHNIWRSPPTRKTGRECRNATT
jgi:hypothetical protein